MPKVVIGFSPDKSETGKTKNVSEQEAITLVREGRARYVDNDSTTSSTTRKSTKAKSGPENTE